MHVQANENPDQIYNDDPFALNSGTIIYCKQHKMNILISDKPGVVQKLPSQQQLFVKIAIEGGTQNLRIASIQLTSDSQLQFNFQFRCNDVDFRRIKEIQKFYIQFRQYPQAIIKNFQRLSQKKNTQNYQANFTIFSETQGKLDIVRKSQFKDDLIMQFNFARSPEEHIQASVQHRYDIMRRQYNQKLKKFQQYRQIVRTKNPSLIMQIDKALKTKK